MQHFQRTDWVSLANIFIQTFLHKCRCKIYLQFVFNVADFILTMPCKVQETDYSRQVRQFEAASFETGINFTYGHWYRPGMVYGQVLEFFFLQGSLQRTWQEARLNFELKVRTADLHS